MGARRGGGSKTRPSPPPLRIFFLFDMLGPFCYFFFIWEPFCYVFLILWAFSPCGGLFAILYFMVEAFFWACPPPPSIKISAGAHDCKEGSRACSPELFLCDRNLVNSGHVLLRFCLKNDKNNDKL